MGCSGITYLPLRTCTLTTSCWCCPPLASPYNGLRVALVLLLPASCPALWFACRASLTRKAVFYADTPAWRLLPMYAKTMFRTQLPMYAAEFIVACAYDAVEEVRRLLHGLQLQQQPGAAAHFQPVPGECQSWLQPHLGCGDRYCLYMCGYTA